MQYLQSKLGLTSFFSLSQFFILNFLDFFVRKSIYRPKLKAPNLNVSIQKSIGNWKYSLLWWCMDFSLIFSKNKYSLLFIRVLSMSNSSSPSFVYDFSFARWFEDAQRESYSLELASISAVFFFFKI